MTQLSAREFNQDVSAAKRAAEKEPVIITDRGRPSHVLISIEEYRRISGEPTGADLVDRLTMGPEGDFEVEFDRIKLGLKVPDL